MKKRIIGFLIGSFFIIGGVAQAQPIQNMPSPSILVVSSTPNVTTPPEYRWSLFKDSGPEPLSATVLSISTPSFMASSVPTAAAKAVPAASLAPSSVVSLPAPKPTPPPPTREQTYAYFDEELYRYPFKPRKQYPDISVDGFYEAQYSGRDYSPKIGSRPGDISPSDNRWDAIRRDPVFNKLPRNVLLGDPQLQIRYQFAIDGQLDEDLRVHYDVEQEPNFPGQYDIWIERKEDKLTFFLFDADFQNGPFINVRKALNGAKYEHMGDSWEAIVATGRQRSDPQKFESFGTGREKINIGNRNVLFGSVKVWVNNKRRVEGVDYQINYYEGEILFLGSIPGLSDYIQVIYEFTNPIENFIPVLNRKNFFGAQYKWRSKPIVKKERLSKIVTGEILRTSKDAGTVDGPSVFFLNHYPVVLGTDVVKVNGVQMARNKDYFLKQSEGRLKFLNMSLTHKDKIEVDYEYYLTDQVSEDLIGKDLKGPYKLTRDNILDGSAKVVLDDRELREAFDYILDYDTGELFFNYIVNYPRVISVEYTAIKTEVSKVAGKENPLRIGVTYLNEYAKGQPEDLILAVVSENIKTSANNTIFTSNTPLINTENIKIFANGHKLASGDYHVVNAYKGQILLSPSVNAASTIVSYTYQKSFSSNYIFTVKGDNQIFINNRTLGFSLNDIPVKKGGIDHIRLLRNGSEMRLREAEGSFRVDYGVDGTAITITFLKQNDAGGRGSQLTDYPRDGELMTIIYQYTPNTSPEIGNIDQKLIGISVGADLSKKWSIQTDIAAANHNFSKPQVDGNFSGTGTGRAGDSYYLGNRNLVENSESVFIRRGRVSTGNSLVSQRLTKNENYVLNYQTGQLKFINFTANKQDEIVVDYKYFDTSSTGTTQAVQQEQFKLATNLEAKYHDEKLNARTYYKYIDRDFLPFAPIQDPKGITQYGGNVDWLFRDKDTLSASYQRQDQIIGKRDNSLDQVRHQDDLNLSAKMKLFKVLDTTQSGRYLLIVQDPNNDLATSNRHPIDSLTLKYDATAAIGYTSFRNRFKTSYGETIQDYLDRDLPLHTIDRMFGYDSDILLKKLKFLREIDFFPTYLVTTTKLRRTALNQSNTANATITKIGETMRINRGIRSQFRPHETLTADLSYNTSIFESRTPEQTTKNRTETINELYGVNYRPFKWIQLAFSHSQDATESPLFNQRANVETNTVHQIKRFDPDQALVHFGMNPKSMFIKPIEGSYLTFSTTERHRRQNNDLDRFSYTADSWGYFNLKLLPGLVVSRLRYDIQESDSVNFADTSVSENRTDSFYEAVGAQLAYNPKYKYLRKFSYTFNMDSKSDQRETKRLNNSITSNITINERPSYTRNQSLTFKPGIIKGKIWRIPIHMGQGTFTFVEDWLETTDRRIEKRIATNQSVSQNITQDNALKLSYTYGAALRPFNKVDVNATLQDITEQYSRNLTIANRGLTFRKTDNFSLSAKYSPFKFLTLDGTYYNNGFEQYRSNNLDAALAAIKAARTAGNGALFSEFIGRDEIFYSLQPTITPFKWVSVRGKGSILDRIEENMTTRNQIINRFDQLTGAAGLVLRPIAGLEISYDYGITRTRQNKTEGQISYQGSTRVNYTPFQRKNFKVNFVFSREDTWGQSFNTLDSDRTQQGTGDILATQLTKVDYTVQQGSLIVDINIPLDSSPFVERLIITGEGHLKQVIDRLDDTKAQKNSYEVSGLILKGTLVF